MNLILLVLVLVLANLVTAPPAARGVLDLNGAWSIRAEAPSGADGAAGWRTIDVPSAFETVLGTPFDGVATYRRTFTLPAGFAGERLVLSFDAAATAVDVTLNEHAVGSHLGGWTTFRFDVTDHVDRERENVLVVRVDERVGHDTQGFLPIIAPHFGGIWQSVSLLGLPGTWIDDTAVLAVGDAETATAFLEAPVVGDAADTTRVAEVEIGNDRIVIPLVGPRTERAIAAFEAWDLDRPIHYPVTFRLLRDGEEVDRVETRLSFRSVRPDGRRLRLNGRPLNVRGILEWGCFPPYLAPTPDDATIRETIASAKARGFNLIKFCLWVPPRRVLRLFDDAGMLAWMEYPTWHPRFDAEHRAELKREFDEFYRHDRNSPSVVLRSLTCETGPSASLEVIRDLYDLAKARIPGAVVEDDSSWIAWNRVHDFYDDHPYGNNKTWPATLERLDRYVAEREPKPLLLGEAIAADTWLDPSAFDGAPDDAWWRSMHEASCREWRDGTAARRGVAAVDDLAADSLRFAMNQRKDQIETFRRMIPDGGYVVSVARDFSKAEMGLADHANRWKWSPADWVWHGDTMLVLGAETKRSVFSEVPADVDLFVAHHGPADLRAGRARWTFDGSGGEIEHPTIPRGAVRRIGTISLHARRTSEPTACELAVSLDDWPVQNRWTFWVVPRVTAVERDVIETNALDVDTLDALQRGANVMLLASNVPGSFVRSPHWYLRGSLWAPPSRTLSACSKSFFLDLVVKDLHPDGFLPVGSIFDEIDPIVAFWDNHDVAEVRDWALAFETNVGEGRLLVTALDHETSPAGAWLKQRFREHLAMPGAATTALSPTTIAAIRDRLVARTIDLTSRAWSFRPDGADEWSEIHVGRSWEGQGHPALDGFATYALDVELDEGWAGEPIHLNLEGVDDAFEVFFDGSSVGTGGDVPTRRTAFAERSSHRLAERATPGTHRLEVRVYDWYGAGGIHRPVSLSTRPPGTAAEFLLGR